MVINHVDKDDQDYDIYIISEGQTKIGHIKVNFELRSILNIWIEENQRKKGYGAGLIAFIESLFVRKGFPKIRTSHINPEARGFFEKMWLYDRCTRVWVKTALNRILTA